MDRLTIRNSDGAWDVPLRNDNGVYIPSQEVIDRLAAYEDTGLEPEEVERYAKAEKDGRLLVPLAAIIKFFHESDYGCPPGERYSGCHWLDAPKKSCGKTISCRLCWLDYLRQEVTE